MNQPCHKCGEICCRCWRRVGTAVLLALLVVAGCTGPKSAIGNRQSAIRGGNIQPPMPPPLPAIQANTLGTVRTASVVSPRTITLQWDKVETDTNCYTQIWSGPTPWNRNVNLKAEVLTNRVTLVCDQPAEFYRIRNRVGDMFSEWGD